MSTTRDQRIAEDSFAERDLMCRAEGCPNRWAVDSSQGRCCSAHAWASVSQWPQITEQQLATETERAFRRQGSTRPEQSMRMTRAEKLTLLHRMRGAFVGADAGPRSWAEALRSREESGEVLTQAQRECWRAALKAHHILDRAKAGAAVPTEDIDAALLITGDMPWPDRVDIPAFDEPMGEAA